MNWKEIKKKYPKAFEKLNKWYGIGLLEFNKQESERYGHYFTDGVHAVLIWNDFEIRDLYDFFDEQGIIIEILWYRKDFRAHVWIKDDKNVKYAKHFKIRKETEEAAFLKAFEILEK